MKRYLLGKGTVFYCQASSVVASLRKSCLCNCVSIVINWLVEGILLTFPSYIIYHVDG